LLARLSIRVPHFSQLTLSVGVSITVTLYLAPQSHVCVPVSHSTNSVMPGICAPNRSVSSPQGCHNQTPEAIKLGQPELAFPPKQPVEGANTH
jgi:hypothetical protein